MTLLSMALPTLAGAGEYLLSGLITLGEFAALISVVVFVHEMGHLLVAKAFGVKAEKFSLGFGPKIFGFTIGETEYRWSLLPFGGYVKFSGDNPGEEVKPEDKGRGFLEASPLARGAIAFAGPFANFLLALVVTLVLHLIPHSEPAPVVGFVKPGSPAAQAGLRHGDKFLAVDGAPVRGFTELQEKVSAVWNRALSLRVLRGAEEKTLSVQPALVEEDSPLGVLRSGRIGISAASRTAQLAVLGPETAAAKAGLQDFDTLTKVGADEVKSYEQLLDLLAARLSRAPGSSEGAVEIAFERKPPPAPLPPAGTKLERRPQDHAKVEPQKLTGQLVIPALGRAVEPAAAEALLGLASSDNTIAHVQPESAAEKAGLRRGDRVLEVQGKKVIWWDDEVERARQAVGPAPLHFKVLRGGATLDVEVAQIMRPGRDDAGVKKMFPELGAFPERTVLRGGDDAWVTFAYPFGEAAVRSVGDTIDKGKQMLLGIARMVTGQLSTQAIGGPLMMADVTRKMADFGLAPFFLLMGWISLNLGLMNLLPIPILDGFHLLSAMIEGVFRRPLSLKFREVANTVGLVFVLGLMLFALTNDVMRKFVE
jgi:regulator of sigma E protease